MEEIKINKQFDTQEELDNYIKELEKEYIIFMINMLPVNIGEEVYGIESIYICGRR